MTGRAGASSAHLPRRCRPFPAAAQAALADTPAARATSRTRPARSAPSGRAVVGEVEDWEELRAGRRRRSRTPRLARPGQPPRAAGGSADRARRRRCTGPATPHEANRIVAELVRRTGVDEVVKVKSMATQEIGLNEALGRRGDRGVGDRPGRADRAARRRPAQPHPGPGDPPQPGRDPRDLHRGDGPGRPTRPGGPDRRARPSWPRPPGCTCARSSCAPGWPCPGANFAVAETGTLVVVESEGNGRMCLTLPEMLVTRRRASRRWCRRWRRPGGVPAAAAALLDRRSG